MGSSKVPISISKAKEIKLTHAEIEKAKDLQLDKILQKPPFDPMGDRVFSESESSAGWGPGDSSVSEFTDESDTEDHLEEHNKIRTKVTGRTVLGSVEEEVLDDMTEVLTDPTSNTKPKEDYSSPQRSEGTIGKRANTQDTPLSLKLQHSFIKSKKRLEDLARTYDEVIQHQSQAGSQVINPYNLPRRILRFGGADVCEYETHHDEMNFDKLDALEYMDDEVSLAGPPKIDRTTKDDESSNTSDDAITVGTSTSGFNDVLDQMLGIGTGGAKVPEERRAVDVGGGGDCLYYVIADQALCDPSLAPAFRAMIAKYLLDNRDSIDMNFMILGDEEEAVTVEAYSARVSTQGEYAGYVELSAFARILQHRIIIYEKDGDQVRTRVIEVDDSGQLDIYVRYYEIEYDHILKHYKSVQGQNYMQQKTRIQIDLKSFNESSLSLVDMRFTSTGRHVDSDGSACGAEDFRKMVVLQGGIYNKTFNAKTSALIVGSSQPFASSAKMVSYAEKKSIPRISYPLLCARITNDIPTNVMMSLGGYIGGVVTVPISCIQAQSQGQKGVGVDGLILPPLTTARGKDKGGVATVPTGLVHDKGQGRPEVGDDDATSPQVSSPPPSRSFILPKSSIKKSMTQETIPINESALNRLRDCEVRTPKYNARPSNLTQSESFIAITFHHDEDDEFSPAVSIRSRFEKIIVLWQTLDPKVAVNGAWTQNVPSPPLLKGGTLPEKWINLQSYLYINNPQSLGSGYMKDGVKQPQGPTYATARITTTLDTTHLLATLAMDLSQMNVRMYVKSLSVLSSKAIVYCSNHWYSRRMESTQYDYRAETGDRRNGR